MPKAKEEKAYADTYEITEKIHIGRHVFVFGVDETCTDVQYIVADRRSRMDGIVLRVYRCGRDKRLSGSVRRAGNVVVLHDGSGTTTPYAHIISRAVNVGNAVNAGDIVDAGGTVGFAGSTGWSTGNNLHFEVRVGGILVNPLNCDS